MIVIDGHFWRWTTIMKVGPQNCGGTWQIGQQMSTRRLTLSNGGRYVILSLYGVSCLTASQDHVQLYPTLARIALDVLPCQASSVPCERLFSASKQTADTRWASLGAKRFEELQVMKSAWRKDIADLAAQNSAQIEEVELDEFSEILEAEGLAAEWDRQIGADWDGSCTLNYID